MDIARSRLARWLLPVGLLLLLSGTPTAGGRVAAATVDNLPPVASGDSFTVAEDSPVIFTEADLLANDADPEGEPMSVGVYALPAHGTLTWFPFIYTPDPNFTGYDSIEYFAFDGTSFGESDESYASVDLTVTAVNDPPVGMGDAFTTGEDLPLTITFADLLANDSDLDGDTLQVAEGSAPSHGTLTDGPVGESFRYTPDSAFSGIDSFTYVASDGEALSEDPVTVTITVTPAVVPSPSATEAAATEDVIPPTVETATNPVVDAETTSPAGGHAEVIAQAVFELADGPLAWTVIEIDAGELATDTAGDGSGSFLLDVDGTVMIRDAAGARTRLEDGEALVVRSDDEVSVRAAGEDPASVSLLTLGRTEGDDSGDASGVGVDFESPGGSRDVEFVRDVLAAGEQTRIVASDAPSFVLVTDGTIEVETDDGEFLTLAVGETALVTGEFVLIGASEEPSSFVVAVIGADVDAAPDATSATRNAQTRSSRPATKTPQATTSTPSPTSAPPTPTPSPTAAPPTPEGNGPADDPDGDGLVNEGEDAAGTDRLDPDTDHDLLSDFDEVIIYLSNPTALDSDGDELYDGDEVIRVGTDPAVWDTDGDLIGDGSEADEYFTNPLKPDTDDDGYDDYLELLRGTDPTIVDTDGDGLTDGEEVNTYHTDPLIYDSDGDNAGDGDEVDVYFTCPTVADCDGDGLTDPEEVFLGTTSPGVYDTDGDGFSDGEEVWAHTYPDDPTSHP